MPPRKTKLFAKGGRHGRALDALNFFLADMNGAFGPFLSIFLLTHADWNQQTIGLVTMVGGLVGLAVQAPIGAFIDSTRAKRGLLIAGMAIVAGGATAVALRPGFVVVLAAAMLMAVAGDVFGPCVTAVSRGLSDESALTRRLGRNSVFDHAGNVAIALAAAAVGTAISQRAVFFLVPGCALLAALAVLSIRRGAIDNARARGLEDGRAARNDKPSSLAVLVENPTLLLFAGCVALFHFANAPLLIMVGQKLALAHKGEETALMAACVIAAQMVMLPMALLVGTKADALGRKPLLLAAFGILPIRAVLYTLSNDEFWLIGVQLLDGVGAGLMNVLIPVILADLTRGTGRFNLSQGAVATIQGGSIAISTLASGAMVYHWGYSVGFLALGAVAVAGFLLVLLAMPETRARRAGG